MPTIGLGFFRMEGRDVEDLLFKAIDIGYRHFDCAGTRLYLSPRPTVPSPRYPRSIYDDGCEHESSGRLELVVRSYRPTFRGDTLHMSASFS